MGVLLPIMLSWIKIGLCAPHDKLVQHSFLSVEGNTNAQAYHLDGEAVAPRADNRYIIEGR
jgi:hypothetical protein